MIQSKITHATKVLEWIFGVDVTVLCLDYGVTWLYIFVKAYGNVHLQWVNALYITYSYKTDLNFFSRKKILHSIYNVCFAFCALREIQYPNTV